MLGAVPGRGAAACYASVLRLRSLAAALAAALLTSCGYIGDPLPPLANVPTSVTDLAAIQRGAFVIAHFTVPQVTTELRPIPQPLTFDLRIGAAAEPFDSNEWAAHARHIPAPEITGTLATYKIPAAGWTGKDAILAVRITAANGKQTAWSNFVVVPVIAPPAKPEAVTAISTAQGVRLTWRGAGDFRILRKNESGEFVQVAEARAPEWTDTTTEFGKRYTYAVQAIVKAGDKQAESEVSEEASITPVDTFPPAVPAGLRADPAPMSIELAWNRNTEPDLAGYRIYRAVGNGALEKLAESSQVPAYSDRAVEHGKTYRYAIASVDRAGNESARSGIVETAY